MSVESLFATANALSPQRSRALQRRLALLQAVLPCFPAAIMRSYHSAKRFNREFWTQLLNPCLSMEMAQFPFHHIDDRHTELVGNVLEKLETLVGTIESDIAEEYKSSSFPRLETIRKLTKESTDDSEDIMIELVKPGTVAGRSTVIELLQNLSTILKDDVEQPPPEPTRTASKSKPLMAPLLLNLFSTISKYWNCSCRSPHQAALLLFTNRMLPKYDTPVGFTLLLSGATIPNPIKRWHEAGVTIREPPLQSNVRFSFPEANIGGQHPVTNLCATIRKSKTRLNLNIEGTSLSSQADTPSQMQNFADCEVVSFTKGFLENASELQIHEKLCLAVILSYAFLDFCGKPWFAKGWTKDSLYLMQHDRTLFLQPFLITSMVNKPDKLQSTPSTTTMRTEMLLLHAALLMEIFEQAPLDVPSSVPGGVAIEDSVRNQFNSINWGVCERFRQAVSACFQGTLINRISPVSIEPQAGSKQPAPLRAEISDEDFAGLFCEEILAPLEADFASQWQNKDPDEVILNIKLPSVKLEKILPLRSEVTVQKTSSRLTSKPKLATTLQRSRPEVLTVTPLSLRNTTARFFDVVDGSHPIQVKGAQQWFENFDADDIQGSLPKRATSKENRIKIAVLDTGINLKNNWISQRTGRIQCWPSISECEDNDGHGTHVAHLLLRLAPHAQLRIAKVSKTKFLKDADIKQIADAIVHFSTGKGRVDIINISFGFPRYITKLRPILTAIRSARDKGVIILAAAGNDGGNKSVFWPATLHDGGDVIRINSSDGNGTPSGFNPDPEVGRRICTLGEGVPSCEPNPKDQGQMIYRSGTSFATPIAAAIAAIVLGFMDNVDSPTKSEDSEEKIDLLDLKELSPRLRTAVGMERVLCELCVSSVGSKRSGFSYITPWHFLGRPEKIRIHLILDILSRVPESPVLS